MAKQILLSMVVGMALVSGSVAAQSAPEPEQVTVYTSSKPLLLLRDGKNTYKLESAAVNMINPEWVEEVEVLKQTNATEKYGAEGEDGVVILVLKKDMREAKKYVREIRRKNEKMTLPMPEGVLGN